LQKAVELPTGYGENLRKFQLAVRENVNVLMEVKPLEQIFQAKVQSFVDKRKRDLKQL
jgi:hypothetical protein